MLKIKKPNNVKNIFQTIILIGAVACVIYGIYTLFIKDNKKIKEPEKLQLKDVKVLYNYLKEAWPDSSFHENKILNVSTIDENVLFTEFIVSEKLDKKTYETQGCKDYMSPCEIATFKYEDVLSNLKKKYGNVSLTKENYSYGMVTCIKENDNFVCYITLGGIIESVNNLSSIVNYVETDEKLEIYDKYIKYDFSDEKAKCYIDNSMTLECNNQKEFNDDLNMLNDEELIDKYGMEYIHTFLKDNDGNYYWYTSKINKEKTL